MKPRTRQRKTLRKNDRLLIGSVLITALKGQNMSLLIEADAGEKYVFLPAPKVVRGEVRS